MDKNNKDKNNKNKKFKITKLLNIVCYILSGLFILTFVFSLCNSCNNNDTNNDNVTGTITKPKSNRFLGDGFSFPTGMYYFEDFDYEYYDYGTSLVYNELFDINYDRLVVFDVIFDVDYFSFNGDVLSDVNIVQLKFTSVVTYDFDTHEYSLRSDDFSWYCTNLLIYHDNGDIQNYFTIYYEIAPKLYFNVISVDVLNTISYDVVNFSFDNLCLTYLNYNYNDVYIYNGDFYFNPVVSNKIYDTFSLDGDFTYNNITYNRIEYNYIGGSYGLYFSYNGANTTLVSRSYISNGVVSTRYNVPHFSSPINFNNFIVPLERLSLFEDYFVNSLARGVSGGFYVDFTYDLFKYFYNNMEHGVGGNNVYKIFAYSFGFTSSNEIGDLSGFKHNGITFYVDNYYSSSLGKYFVDIDVFDGYFTTEEQLSQQPGWSDTSSLLFKGTIRFSHNTDVVPVEVVIPSKLDYITIDNDFYLKINDFNNLYPMFSTTVYSVAQYRTSLQVTTLDAVFGLINKAFSSLAPLFNIVVFPNISLGLLLLIPLIITILIIIFRLVVS